MLSYQEFFYQEHGFDTNFDSEFEPERDWQRKAKLIMKNAYLHVTLEQSTWNISPTHFQASSFPEHWRSRISVIHDGVDMARAVPDPSPAPMTLPDGTRLEAGQPVVTFVNRRLEPYRGCHTFIRALPALQKRCPDARIIVVGETTGVSYGAACPDGEWRDRFLAEIEGRYDPSRVHFTGTLPYSSFIPLLQLSACHVYLTYPFVMSWSLLEAMACGLPVAAFPVTGPIDVVGDSDGGVLDNDLAIACQKALKKPRGKVRAYAETFSWDNASRIFLSHLVPSQVPADYGVFDNPYKDNTSLPLKY